MSTRALDDAALQQLHDLRVDVRELRNVWRGAVMPALRELRDPQPLNRVDGRLPSRSRGAADPPPSVDRHEP